MVTDYYSQRQGVKMINEELIERLKREKAACETDSRSAGRSEFDKDLLNHRLHYTGLKRLAEIELDLNEDNYWSVIFAVTNSDRDDWPDTDDSLAFAEGYIQQAQDVWEVIKKKLV
jgi:hypothetical protein